MTPEYVRSRCRYSMRSDSPAATAIIVTVHVASDATGSRSEENHRIGLHDMFLVKNNHVDRAGSITAAVERIRARRMPQKLMVEVRSLAELDETLALGPDFILLDNMNTDQLREAVRRTGGRVPLEASGGITLETIRSYAEAGVDIISVGALTHSPPAADIHLRVIPV